MVPPVLVAPETVPPATSRGPWGWLGRLGPGGILAGAALVAVLVVLCRRVGDPDFYWHLATGQWILDHGRLPNYELFTYTVGGHPWADQEYGSEILIALIFRGGGFLAVSLTYTAVTWAGFWLMWRRIGLEKVPPVIAAICLLLAAAAGVAVWGPRSQMISFALTCLTLYWVEAFLRDRHRHVYWLPALVVVWANLHGGFIYALMVVGLAALSETILGAIGSQDPAHRRRALRLWVVLVASALAALVNPHTFQVYLVTLYIEFSKVQQTFIAEWQTPSFHSAEELGLEAMLLLTLAAMAIRRQRLWDVLSGMFAVYLALAAVRNASISAALATPLLAWAGTAAWARTPWGDRFKSYVQRRAADATFLVSVVTLAVVVGTVGFAANTLNGQTASTDANFPVAATDCLLANPDVGTRMLNAYDWGGYLLYRFYPQDLSPTDNRQVFIYGEATLMGNALVQQISDVENAEPDWQRILEENRVDYVVERADSALTMALSVDPQWKLVYDDGFAVILVKQQTLDGHPWNASAPACRAGRPSSAA